MESADKEKQGVNREIIEQVGVLFRDLYELCGQILAAVDSVDENLGHFNIALYEYSRCAENFRNSGFDNGIKLVVKDAIEGITGAVYSIQVIVTKALKEAVGDRSSYAVIQRIEDICRDMVSEEDQYKWFVLIDQLNLSVSMDERNQKIEELEKIFVYMTARIEMEAKPAMLNFEKFLAAVQEGKKRLEAASEGFKAKLSVVKKGLGNADQEKVYQMQLFEDSVDHYTSYIRGYFSALQEPIERLPEQYGRIGNSVDALVRAMMSVLSVLKEQKDGVSN